MGTNVVYFCILLCICKLLYCWLWSGSKWISPLKVSIIRFLSYPYLTSWDGHWAVMHWGQRNLYCGFFSDFGREFPQPLPITVLCKANVYTDPFSPVFFFFFFSLWILNIKWFHYLRKQEQKNRWDTLRQTKKKEKWVRWEENQR